jgi:hypothetical protein
MALCAWAFVSTVAGMQVFEEGLPNRPYAVIGKLLVGRRRGPIIQEGVVKETLKTWLTAG